MLLLLLMTSTHEGTLLTKKGLMVWLFSSLTFISLAHFIEAVTALIFNNQIRLLSLYPFIGQKLQTLAPATYFWLSTAATVILWGITCAVTFDNPVEAFLNKILSDAKQQTAVETQLLDNKSELLDLMYETIESDNEILAQVKDLMTNVRADVRDIQPLKESIEKTRAELSSLKKEIRRTEEKAQYPILCTVCGKALMPEFKMCPYCGAQVKVQKAPLIDLKDYK